MLTRSSAFCVSGCIAALALALSACAPETPPPEIEPPLVIEPLAPSPEAEAAAQIADGRAIAERECASCHALDAGEDSAALGAPPLAELLVRFDQDVLANDLIEGIKLGHENMPLFDFNVIAADALVAYLRSIRPEPDAGNE